METWKTQTETPKDVGPPRPIGALVEMLVPAVFRNEVAGDWGENYVSMAAYAVKVAKGLPVIVLRQIRNTFDPTLVTGEACVLLISFNGGPLLPLIFVVAVALSVLVIRDAYIDPARRSQKEAVTHAITAATVAFLSQILFSVIAPTWTLPPRLMMRGAAISAVMISGWRLIFYLRRPPKDAREATAESYKATGQINALWLSGCMVLMMTGTDAVPASVPGRDFGLTFLPLAVFFVAKRLQMNPLDTQAARFESLDLSGKLYKKQMQWKRELLFTGSNTWLEFLYFVLLAAPLCLAFWRWWNDDPSAESMNWQQVGANFGAFVSLSLLWIYIKRMNRKTAGALQEQIDTFRDQEKK